MKKSKGKEIWIKEFDDRSYRSILKWGDPKEFKHPKPELLDFMKEVFGLTDNDLSKTYKPGLEKVVLNIGCRIPGHKIVELKNIVGEDNVSIDDYDRAKHAYGKMFLDALKLRLNEVPNPPDVVVYPRNEEDVKSVVRYCDDNGIVIVPAGAMSSVTRAIEFPGGGVCLDLTRHMNKVIEINELDSSVTVQPGIFGPAFEEILNNYKTESAPDGYTCGHFPQSFEFSTVGGWIAARGAGQQSTGYGKIENIVLGMKVMTPSGPVNIEPYPAKATGPDIGQLMIGSEGIYGVITEATLKLRRFGPDNRRYFSYMFKTWQDAVDTCREIMQGEFGTPSVLRISDPEETMIGLKLYGLDGTAVDKIISAMGYKPMKRCLMLGSTEGDADAGELIKSKVKNIAKKNGGFAMGGIPVKSWWKNRYKDPYMREDLMDLNIMTDTLETSVRWSNLMEVWENVRKVVKSRPNTACTVHASHFYENGANLYFIFLSKMEKGNEVEDYKEYHTSIVSAIRNSGGTLSHHHCVGRMLAPWMLNQVGAVGIDIIEAVKKQVDPNNIMNPGGTLGIGYEGDIR
ncbi:MAG TPA: FAD-binding oxidoreductase [bacterium]|nr:FAD-binding oxidoreductase [bacterium]